MFRSSSIPITISTHCAHILFSKYYYPYYKRKNLWRNEDFRARARKAQTKPEVSHYARNLKKMLKQTWRHAKRSQEQIKWFSIGQTWSQKKCSTAPSYAPGSRAVGEHFMRRRRQDKQKPTNYDDHISMALNRFLKFWDNFSIKINNFNNVL